ncbi:MAG: prefoldin subunit beta [Nitrosopumilus sp.]|nr:prefoldin subunit beta [Nitrosopumilus sp.]MDH3340047.1 prefoldin subunit beta [Nitrosopumilus sp.]
MSSPQMPPWLQEQMMKLQQSQQNLQSVMNQKQHLEMEKAETAKALDELKKVTDSDAVFKQAGTVLIKSTKQELIDELEERAEMAKTRVTVLDKQEIRLKESLKEQETKITEMMKGGSPNPSTTEDNPRK